MLIELNTQGAPVRQVETSPKGSYQFSVGRQQYCRRCSMDAGLRLVRVRRTH